MAYWLMKSEPDAFSIDDLASCVDQTEPWDGIRNYQARNFMRDDMKLGDQVFFYHSNCNPPGIVGIAEVASTPYPDPTAFDPDSEYYVPKSDPDKPRWVLIDLKLVEKWPRLVSLQELRDHHDQLDGFRLLAKGNRLSIIPVEDEYWNYITGLGRQP